MRATDRRQSVVDVVFFLVHSHFGQEFSDVLARFTLDASCVASLWVKTNPA